MITRYTQPQLTPNPFAFHVVEPIQPFSEESPFCHLDPQRIRAIQNNILDMFTPIEGQCSGFEVRETLLEKLMRGVRKAMALTKSIFGNKYDAQEKMRALMQDLLHLRKPLFPRTVPLKVPVSISPSALQKFQEPLVAVRSSCPNEDEEHDLKAGKFLTLFVPREVDQIAKAALKVTSSCDTPSFGTFAQEYIGDLGDDIPIAAGHISGTPSITTATFGQGKGVVDGGVPVHTFHCIPSAIEEGLYCHRHTPKIPERWTLSSDGQLMKVSNPDALATAPTLSMKHLSEIRLIASLAQSFFECQAVNLEFVLREGEIYALQFRCISQLPKVPTYLDAALPDALPIEVYTPGNLSVTLLHSPAELLMRPTLKEAYRDLTPATKAAAVSEPETSDVSHPIASFNSLNELTFRTNLTALANLSFPLAVDPQTSRAFPWNPALEEHIRSGYLLFPGTLLTDSPYPPKPPIPPTADLEELTSEALAKIANLRPMPYLERLSFALAHTLQERRALPPTDPRVPFLNKVLIEALRSAPNFDLLLKYQESLPDLADLLLLAQQIRNPKVFPYWEKTLRTFAGHPEIIRPFVSFLQELDAFRDWLLFFPPTSIQDFSIAPEEQQFLRTLSSQPWDFFLSPAFTDSFKKLSPIGRLIALRQMHHLVDTFDLKLKALQEKRDIKLFQKTLSSFFSLLQSWQPLIPHKPNDVRYNHDTGIISHLQRLINTYPPPSDALDYHPNFDSSKVLLLPSQMIRVPDLEIHKFPTNLLDAFMATHQILINDVIGSCAAQLFPLSSPLWPDGFKQMLEKLLLFPSENQNLSQAQAVLVSVESTDEEIAAGINLPLRNHAATMRISLNYSSGLYTLSFSIYNIEVKRAQELTDWIGLLHKYEFPRTKFSSKENQFSCEVTTDRGTEVLDFYIAAIDYTLDQNLERLLSHIRSPILEQHLVQHMREFAKKHLQNPSFKEKHVGLGFLEALARKGHPADAIQWLEENLFTMETVQYEASAAWIARFEFHQATMRMLCSLVEIGHAHDFARTVIQRWKGHRYFWSEAMQLEDLLKK